MSTRSRNWLKFGALVALAFVLGLFFAGLLDFPRSGLAQERAARTPIVRVSAPSIPAARPLIELSDAYAAVAEAVRPSVVYIQSEEPATADDQSQIIGQLPPQFQQMLPRQQRGRQAEPEIEHSSGSGFIVSNDGYILTNNHVIAGATRVTVRLLDGRQFDAKIVGTDKDTDIGVLKIDATGLTPAALGSSDATKVGEWVLAIGNPLGADLTFTVTQGIVSAKGRGSLDVGDPDRDQGRMIQDYIQTDAVINRGNSGGPLVNARGEVIGINAAIASGTGYFNGYAFAVPIDLARKVMDQILAHGKVERAGMSILVTDATREDAQYLGLPTIGGVLISGWGTSDSPAKRAGLQLGDVITAIDGQPISYTAQLQQTVGFRRPGETVKVDVMRKDGKHTYNVTLTSVEPVPTDSSEAAPVGGAHRDSNSAGSQIGITAEPLTAEMASQFGLPSTTRGIVVDHIVPDSPAEGKFSCVAEYASECGIPDVIVQVEGKPVTTDQDFRNALATGQHGIVTLEVVYGNKDNRLTRTVRVRTH